MRVNETNVANMETYLRNLRKGDIIEIIATQKNDTNIVWKGFLHIPKPEIHMYSIGINSN